MDITQKSPQVISNTLLGRLERFISPSQITNPDIQRRIRLLLIIDLIAIAGNILGLIALPVILDREPRILFFYFLPPIITILLIAVGFYLCHTARYRRGIYVTLAGILLNGYGAILVTSGPEAFSYVAMVMAGPLIASLVLNIRDTAKVALIAVIGLIITFIIHGPTTALIFEEAELGGLSPFAQTISILITFTLCSVVLVSMRLRDMLEADRLEAQRLAILEKERAEAFRQADEVKSTFLATMSHELRTPLNAVINFSKIMKKGVPGPVNEQQAQLLGNIADSGQHLLNLINDVMDMSKIEAGALQLFVEPDVDIRKTIITAGGYVESLVIDKPVQLQYELPEALPPITGDNKRLLQVFLNILSNACKFTDEGYVRMSASVKPEHLLISVEDTGVGIAPADREHVFASFRQTESGRRTGGGTGLGMPISKKLVEAHNGRLWFESQPGVGTTFYVELPLETQLEEKPTSVDEV